MPSLEAKHIIATPPPAKQFQKRNLGGAIILEQIAAYRSMDDFEHKEAAKVLYPSTTEAWLYWDWIVSVAEPMKGEWLREMLDKSKPKWDAERERKKMPPVRVRGRFSPKPQLVTVRE